MKDYTLSRATATRLITRFGGDALLVTATPGGGPAYNPGAPIETETPVKAAIVDYTAREREGSSIEVGDRRALVTAGPGIPTPSIGTLLRFRPGPFDYQIMNVDVIRPEGPGGVAVVYDLQVRAGQTVGSVYEAGAAISTPVAVSAEAVALFLADLDAGADAEMSAEVVAQFLADLDAGADAAMSAEVVAQFLADLDAGADAAMSADTQLDATAAAGIAAVGGVDVATELYSLTEFTNGGMLLNAALDPANYQTSAGIALAGAGDPVGLVLGSLALGPELVGAATVLTTIPAKTTYNGAGRITVVGATVGEVANAALTEPNAVSGNVYKYTVTLHSIAGDSLTLLRPSSGNFGEISTPGVYEFVTQATSTVDLVRVLEWAGTLTDYDITVSIREIPGAHFTSATTARPTRPLTSGVWGYQFDGTDDKLEGNAASLDILKDAPGVTFVCAVRFDVSGAAEYVANWQTALGAARFIIWKDASDNIRVSYRRLDADSAVNLSGLGAALIGETQVLAVTLDVETGGAAGCVVRRNGSQIGSASIAGTGNFSDTASSAVAIGSSTSSTEFLDGLLAGKLFLAPRVLSASELAFVEAQVSKAAGL